MRKRSLWTIAMLTGCCILAGCSNQGTQTDTAQQSQEESVADTEENTDQNTPPEKPDGEAPDGEKPDGAPPDGQAPDGNGPGGEKPDGEAPDGKGGPGGQSQAPTEYDAQNTYTEDAAVTGESISSTGTDENAVLVQSGATVSLSDTKIDRTSDASTGGDSSSFYGVGAAVLTTDGTVKVTNSSITTDAAGAAGVFAYGDGVAEVLDTTITTGQDTSGGIHVAGGGTLKATNLTVETSGESSAAIRSDRGGGTMTVNGGSYTSNGTGSPAVYSTADITVSDATLTANGSEAVCIEGLNSLKLTNCDLTGNMQDLSQNDCTWNVILYQSMSGDSEVGNSTFSMTGGSLRAMRETVVTAMPIW